MHKHIPVLEKFSPEQKRALLAPFQLDLISLFSAIQNDVMKLLDVALKEGKTAEQFIQEVRDLI